MLLVKIKENTQQARLFAQYIKTLPFVEVVDQENNVQISKNQFLDDFKTSLKEVKQKKSKTLNNLFSGK